jgi:hypothetical protein
MNFLASLWNRVRQGLGLVLPLFAKARDYRGLGTGLRWAIHVLLVAAILIGLFALNNNNYVDLKAVLGHAPLWLKPVWLPLLFVVVYALSWLGWWLWKLLWPEKEVSDFPDIDDAWEEAVGALHQGGIDPTEAPLFLVLGRPLGGEAALFSAAQLKLTVTGAPRYPHAPLHVYASRDGIYVTCAGASLLGHQAALFAEGDPGAGESAASPEPAADDPEAMYKTMRPSASGNTQEIQAILRRANAERRDLTEEERRQVRLLGGLDGAQGAARPVRRRPLLKSAADVELMTARFRHFCGLLVRDRRPYCPVNGIMVLLPLAATEIEEAANQVGGLVQQDLAAARAVLQLHCPVFGLLCDLETAPGFVDFLERFPEEQRHRRVGQRFPLVPDLPEEEVPPVLERLVRWVCNDHFATWAYRLFRVETPEKRDMAEAVRGNVRLYGLLRHMHEVDRPLARLVTRGLGTPHNGLLMLGGVYIAGTGLDPVQQGFIAGVFRRLIEGQNYVAWTDEGLAEEADYDRWAQRGYLALVLLAVAAAVLAYLVYATMSST